MGFELERVLYETEDFLRRNVIRSRAAREAQEAAGAAQDGGGRCGGCGGPASSSPGCSVALVLASILLGSFGFLTWLVAIPTALLFALHLAVLADGRRRPRAGRRRRAPAPAARRAGPRAEEGLLDRSDELPGPRARRRRRDHRRASTSSSPISTRSSRNSMLAGDARRLIGQHLPRLVDSYLDLPAQRPRAEQRSEPPLHREPRHRRQGAGRSARPMLPRPASELRHPAPLHRDPLPRGSRPQGRVRAA